jgi:AcrR family transcriptional regulator
MAAMRGRQARKGRASPQKGSKRRPTQEQRSGATRAKLIQATIECIREHGYSATRTSEIAERAGLTRGALQHHFSTKPDLLLAVVASVSEEILEHLRLAERKKGSLRERVETTLQEIWDVYRSPGYHVVVEILVATRSDEDLRKTLDPYTYSIENVLREWWASFFSDVGVPPDRIEATRHMVRSALRGMAISTDYFPQPERYYKEQVDLLADMVTPVLSAPGGASKRRG